MRALSLYPCLAGLGTASLALALGLSTAPAHAITAGSGVMFTGANCSSDQPSALTFTGMLENRGLPAAQSPVKSRDYATFDCAINLPSPMGKARTLLVMVMGQGTTRTDVQSSCTLAVVYPMGPNPGTVEFSKVSVDLPPSWTFASLRTPVPQVSGWFPLVLASAHLRCKLYNSDSAPRGGIVAYHVELQDVE
jgi:hypothetical protein